MGQKTKGGMWCPSCQRPVMGVKNTHRVRNAGSVAGVMATGGLSLFAMKSERYVCPICGSRVVLRQPRGRPDVNQQIVELPPGAHEILIANYDGRCSVYPKPMSQGTFRLATEGWELRFPGSERYIRGSYSRYLLKATPNGTHGCVITMTDKQNQANKWAFEMPGRSAPSIERLWMMRQPMMPPWWLAQSKPGTEIPPIGIADEIAKLGELRDNGLLTDDEFNAQKARLLGAP